ncbi:MAG: hypothetical protein GY866_33950 [Proteobacteria bacterium]|nr:hypothetical protein [Pseudomonadota bacterium]
MRYSPSFRLENIGLIGIEEASMIMGESPGDVERSIKAGKLNIKPVARRGKVFFRRGLFWSWLEKRVVDEAGRWTDVVKQPAICL